MRVVVTGGLGFIGHKVVTLLEELEQEIAVIDNRKSYGLVELEQYKSLLAYRKTHIKTQEIYSTSINDEWATYNILEEFKPNVVIHLAGAPNQRAFVSDSRLSTSTMSMGLTHVIEAAKSHGVERFVYISSSMVYGSFDKIVDETHSVDPKNIYGVWKLAGEMLVKNAAQSGMSYTIVRPSGVYGPGDLPYRAIPSFVRGALANDTIDVKGRYEKVDFTHVDDVARGIVLAAFNDNAANQTYNIASGMAVALMDAALMCVKYTGQGVINIREADSNQPSRNALSIEKAQRDLGYNPSVDFAAGLYDYINWHKANML